MKHTAGLRAFLLASSTLLAYSSVSAADLYWDGNDATAGAGGINMGEFASGSTAQGAVSFGTTGVSGVATLITLGAAQTWTNNSTNALVLNTNDAATLATLSGSAALTTVGTGRIVIRGNNTGFSGNVLVSSGELEARTNVTNAAGSSRTGNIEISGGDVNLGTIDNTISEVTGGDTSTIQAGLPSLSTG